MTVVGFTYELSFVWQSRVDAAAALAARCRWEERS